MSVSALGRRILAALVVAVLAIGAASASSVAAAPKVAKCVITPKAKCAAANLSHRALVGARLAGANLTRANLAGANLSRADLTGARLTGANLKGTKLTGARLDRVVSGAIKGKPVGLAKGWQLRGGYFLGAGASLRGMSLQGIDLTGAHLEHADLRGARLDRSTLNQAHLNGALMGPPPAAGKGAKSFSRREMSCGRACTGASLIGANLVDADLSGVDLSSANLNGVNAANAIFHGANFTNATMIGANFVAADLSSAVLSGVNIDGADFFHANFDGAQTDGLEGTPKTLPDGLSLGGGRIRTVLATPAVSISVGAGQLTLGFGAVANASSYSAQVCNIAGSDCTPTIGVASGHVFTGLTGGTTYTVKVVAVGDGTKYADSAPGSTLGKPDPVKLDPPAFSLTRGYGTLTIAFAPNAHARSHKAELCDAAGTSCGIATEVTPGRILVGLLGGTTYTVKLTAVGDGTAFIDSDPTTQSAVPFQAPLDPPTLTVTPGAGTLAVAFPAVANATSYSAMLCDAAGASCDSPTTITSGHVFTSLTGGTTYTVKVRAIGDGALFGDSSYASATGAPAITLATPTVSLTPAPGSLALGFTPDPHAASYSARVCNAAGAGCSVAATVEDGHVFRGLLGGTTYTVKLTAIGNGVSYVDSAVGSSTGMPTRVTLATPSLSFATTFTSITVSFTPDPDARWYSAQLCNDQGLACGAPESVVSGTHAFTSLSAATTYTVKMFAGGDGIAYDDSATASGTATTGVTPPTPLPTPVINLTPGIGTLTLTFTPSLDASSYTAKVCNASGSSCGGATTVTSGNVFTGLVGGTTYTVKVTAREGGSYADSAEASATGTPLTQLAQPTFNVNRAPTSLSVDLNPAANALSYTLQVCDGSGGNCGSAQRVATSSSLYPGLSPQTNYTLKLAAIGAAPYADSPVSSQVVSTTAKTHGPHVGDLAGNDLTGRDFSGRDFTGSNVWGGGWLVNWSNTDWTGATLRSVIQGANFTGANLVGLKGDHLQLWGVYTWSTLTLPAGYSLVGNTHANDYCYGCGRSDWGNWQAAFLAGPGVNLSSEPLNGIDMSGLNLSGVNFQGANFTGANLNSANMSFTNLSRVIWSNTTCPDGTNSNAHGSTCAGHLF